MNLSRPVVLWMLCVLVPVDVEAGAACRAASGPLTRPVVELYTSEGCDSCPPADRWFSETFKDTRSDPVALAFHVDYWDRLGWKDRFASAAYTERQHHAADANRASFVYTPQVLLQGRDLGWRDGRAGAALQQATKAPAAAALELTVERKGGRWHAHARAAAAGAALPADAVIWLAYVDSGLVSDVAAGENRGVQLHHDHVVRALASSPAKDPGALAADASFDAPREPGRDPAIVAFVQRAREGAILQAVALPLADCRSP